MPVTFHKRCQWFSNRMLFENYLFRLEHFKNEPWDSGEDHFVFYKVKELVDEYGDYFERMGDFKCRNLLEVGVFQGGSMPFWNEIFNPQIHVGIDLREIRASDYFLKYISLKKNEGREIRYFSGIDQADKATMKEIVRGNFTEPLDLIIDDASHLYGPSKATFEALFPRLRPGGLYIIEDWAWGHWTEFFGKDHFWAHEEPPTRLITELIEFTGSDRMREMIRSLTVYEGFIVAERGPHLVSGESDFKLGDHIRRKPYYARPSASLVKLKSIAKKILGRSH